MNNSHIIDVTIKSSILLSDVHKNNADYMDLKTIYFPLVFVRMFFCKLKIQIKSRFKLFKFKVNLNLNFINNLNLLKQNFLSKLGGFHQSKPSLFLCFI